MHFGAQSRGLRTPCERFAPWVTPGPRITRFRLVADLGRMGLDTHRVSNKVSKITSRHLVPLDRAFPAHTLLHAALAEEASVNRCIVCVKNPTLTRSEFLEFLTSGFGLKADRKGSKSRFLVALERALLERRRSGGLSALIIDEAQALPDALLEEIRLLANLETPTEKLPVILVGQPELSDRLNDQSLRQLKQRVALRSTLQPLVLQETAAYISARIRTAGGKSHEIFTREAVIAVHRRSGEDDPGVVEGRW